jgi:hypothetical protein
MTSSALSKSATSWMGRESLSIFLRGIGQKM